MSGTMIFSIILLVLSVTAIDEANGQIIQEKPLEAKIDAIERRLAEHEDKTNVQFLHGINIALIALIISLVVSSLAAWQSKRNTKETHTFITKSMYLQDANSYFNNEKHFNAKKFYDLYLEYEPNDVKRLINTGACAQNLKEFHEAIKYYEKVLQIDSSHTGALNNLGTCYRSLGDLPKALECYETALKIDKNHADTLNNIGTLYYDSLTKTYDVKLKNANFEKAISYFDKIIDHKLLSGNEMIEILLNKANALTQSGKTSDAVLICNDVLTIDSNNISALLIKGVSLMRVSLYQQALICFDIILKKDSMNDKALLNKGACYLEMNKPKYALKYFNEFVIKNPNDYIGYLNIGNIFAKMNDHKNAIPHYESGVQIEPNNLELLLNLGSSYMYENDLIASKKYLLRAFNENSQDIDVLTSLGACCIKRKELKDAITYLKMGLKINPYYESLLKNIEGMLRILKESQGVELVLEIQKSIEKEKTITSD